MCLSVILIDSDFKMGKICYPQVFLEEYKYAAKENKISKFANNELKISSDEEIWFDSWACKN